MGRSDPTSPLNSSKDLIKAYPDWFKGIGQFPGIYHITLQDDANHVVLFQLFQLKSLLIGSLLFPTHGRQMENYESVSTQSILM